MSTSLPAQSGNTTATMTDAPAVAVDKLRITVSGTERLIADDVSFEVPRAEVLGLVGESGSGKTAVALALLGYARPGTTLSSGQVRIAGEEILRRPSQQLREMRRRLVSYVPQDPSTWLNPAIRIGKQLGECLTAMGKAERGACIEEVLHEVKLPAGRSFLRRYPHQLSGGQQQRVALAMAFASRPPLVVLDEPTTGLDVSTQAHVLETVRELCRTHHTAAIYVTHDIAAVRAIASRFAVMYAGQFVELGEAETIVSRPAHPYARLLLNAVPDPRYRKPLVGIPGRVVAPGKRTQACVFANRCTLVQDECRQHPIAMEAISDEHQVRCRRWSESIASESTGAGETGSFAAAPVIDGSELLAISGLRAYYGATEVLHGIDLAVPRGECLALVGESGSGKTTLARCIGGIHPDHTGQITMDGELLQPRAATRQEGQRQTIQYIFQNSGGAFNPRRSVGHQVEQPLKHFGLPCGRKRIVELLEQVALPGSYIDRLPSQLSGGEQQRLAIARAVAVQPSLLICDEITSALDVSVQASILALLIGLQREARLTMLFVTHNVAVVRALADSIAVMQDGAIVERGRTASVLDAPKTEYTRQLIRDTPVMR